LNIKKLLIQEIYKPIGKLIVERFLKSGKPPRKFLLSYPNKSKSTMISVYFALKLFYENVLI